MIHFHVATWNWIIKEGEKKVVKEGHQLLFAFPGSYLKMQTVVTVDAGMPFVKAT